MPGINGQLHLGTGAVIGTEEQYVPRDRSKRFWANILHVSAPDQGAGLSVPMSRLFLAVGLTLFGLKDCSSWAILVTFLGLGIRECYCPSWAL